MTTALVTEIVDPHALCELARESFTDALYETHRQIFSGVNRQAFAKYVVDSPAERTRIQVFRAGERIVGYAAFHVFERDVRGQASVILRSEVGLLPAFRRGTRFGAFLLRETLRALRTRAGRPVWGLSCATNPATYRTLARHADRVWPCPDRPTPPALAELMDELAGAFGLEPVEGAHPGVFHVGWTTRQDEEEARRWQRCEDPASQFYLRRNPGYTQGHGMLILVPTSISSLLRARVRLAITQLRRRVRRLRRRLAPIPARVPMQPSTASTEH